MGALIVYCTILTFLASYAQPASSVAPEKDLAKFLLSNYAKIGIEGRPVKKVENIVQVKARPMLQRILSLDSQSVTLALWTSMVWVDPFLTWDPASFSGIKSIPLPAKNIWKPDFLNWLDVENNKAEQINEMNVFDVFVTFDGTVRWVPRVKVQTICTDMEQIGKMNCSLMFGSWIQDGKQIEYSFENDKPEMDLTHYRPTPGIELVEQTATKTYRTYPCCPGSSWPTLTYYLILRKATTCSSNAIPVCKVN